MMISADVNLGRWAMWTYLYELLKYSIYIVTRKKNHWERQKYINIQA